MVIPMLSTIWSHCQLCDYVCTCVILVVIFIVSHEKHWSTCNYCIVFVHVLESINFINNIL